MPAEPGPGIELTFTGGVHFLPYERTCPRVDYEAGAASTASVDGVSCSTCLARLRRDEQPRQ